METGVIEYEAKDGQTISLSFETIRKYLVSGHAEMVTSQEMMFFMGLCKSRGLNPFIKDCYLIKYSQKDSAAIVTSIDYFRKRAKAQRDCLGWAKGIIVENADGKVIHSNGLLRDGETLLGGWFRATPKGWSEPFEHEVNLNGYIKKTSQGAVTRFWSKENQPSQIAKVAESQGLRILWPDEFQQLYTPEEMGQPDSFKQAEGAIEVEAEKTTEDIEKKVLDAANEKTAETHLEDPEADLIRRIDQCKTTGFSAIQEEYKNRWGEFPKAFEAFCEKGKKPQFFKLLNQVQEEPRPPDEEPETGKKGELSYAVRRTRFIGDMHELYEKAKSEDKAELYWDTLDAMGHGAASKVPENADTEFAVLAEMRKVINAG